MPSKALRTVDVRGRHQWRKWLEAHHRSDSEVWLIFHKRHTGGGEGEAPSRGTRSPREREDARPEVTANGSRPRVAPTISIT